MEKLCEKIENYLDFADDVYTVPDYIRDNLKHELWYWQKDALQYFEIFEKKKDKFEDENDPTHLMFNMATGTGKTHLMAALILYYYKKGYRHYMFFVNQNNIVDKTENNFINKNHTKYLFRENVVIDDKIINIRKVETFDNTDDIQIKFTSIQKLHNAVYLSRENVVTLEDLQKLDLVMIGDEAHHLNAATSRNGQMEIDLPIELKENASEQDLERSWENTVNNKILKRGKSRQDVENKNVLLEFTATIPQNTDVIEKYRAKTIYKFDLPDFLKAGYTKEINLVSTSLEKKEKILLALLFNWYRHQIALKNDIPNFKPVILFRSKIIAESKADYEYFLALINDLSTSDFDFLKNVENSIKTDISNSFKVYEQGKSRIKQMIGFIIYEKVKTIDIVNWIKSEFLEKNCIITNSKDNKATTKEITTEEQDQLLNCLEDKNNHIRAIFTVKRLTEGWDVLNLYDIVRLYEGRDESLKKGKRTAGLATIQETQLIGRGVRYYPFGYGQHQKNKRKFDNDLENPMRVLEEFYYHSDDDNRYLDELKRELKNKGFIQENRVCKKFELKKEFKDSTYFKEIKVWKNNQEDNPERRKMSLLELEKIFIFEYKINELMLKEEQIVLNEDTDEMLSQSKQKVKSTIFCKFSDFEKHIIHKAINRKSLKDFSLLRFENLHKELNLESIEELFLDKFIGNFKISIIVTKDKKNLNDISNEDQLKLLLAFFEEFERRLKEISNPFKGTAFMPYSFSELFDKPKEKLVNLDKYDQAVVDEFKKYNWFVTEEFTCTSEEKELLEFFKNKIGNFENKYEKVYLMRNEEVYKIYDFEKGRGFEPDFLLFLKGKTNDYYYQIFIEPKGSQFLDKDGGFIDGKEGWKEEFLQQITNQHGNAKLLKVENKDYFLIGLPLFNTIEKNRFEEAFNKHLLN